VDVPPLPAHHHVQTEALQAAGSGYDGQDAGQQLMVVLQGSDWRGLGACHQGTAMALLLNNHRLGWIPPSMGSCDQGIEMIEIQASLP
jgi:hypothetical protein